MNRYAISDIHGCVKTFENLLKRLAFSKDDVLYLLGDYIDRGPDSKGVIDHIIRLKADGYQVHCLRGNHEQMLLDAYRSTDIQYGMDQAMLSSFQVTSVKSIPDKYIQWMDALPYYFNLDDYILVHAGLNFKGLSPFENEADMIWIRYWYDDINEQWLGGRIVVHGHTPIAKMDIKKSIHELDEIPAIDIDAGCVFKSIHLGYLCALNLDTKQLTFERNMDVVSN